MARDFVCLAVMDWYSRRVQPWRVSITMDTDFCLAAVEEVACHGMPDIFNSDQGSKFTSAVFIGLLWQHGIAISMDGKGCWRDNVFVGRLWRSIKRRSICMHQHSPFDQPFDLLNVEPPSRR